MLIVIKKRSASRDSYGFEFERGCHALLLIPRNAVGSRDVPPTGDRSDDNVDDLFAEEIPDTKIRSNLPRQI